MNATHLPSFSPAGWAVLLALTLFICPFSAQAQVRPLASSGDRSLRLMGDSLWLINAVDLTARNLGRPTWFDAFDEKTLPYVNSGSWDAETDMIWLWDYSVGSTIHMTGTGDLVSFSPRRSSWVQFQHAGGLHPIDGTPLAYGGYGYYRAKEFMVNYSPSADNWNEVPFANAPPPARLNAIMISGIDSTRIVIAGGDVSEAGVYPPANNIAAGDAWSFDFSTMQWQQLPFEEWVLCSMTFTRSQLGDIPVRDGRALLFSPEYCPFPWSFEPPVRTAILSWEPLTGEASILGSVEDLPNPYRIMGLYLDESGSPQIAVTSGTDETYVGPLLRGSIRPLEANSLRLAAPPRFPAWWWSIALMVALLSATGVQMTRRFVIEVDASQGRVVFRKGFTRHITSPSPSVAQLAAAFATQPTSRRFSADFVGEHFDALIADPDAARVAKNRALNDLNELSRQIGLGEVVQRVRNSSDKRKFDYICSARFRTAS